MDAVEHAFRTHLRLCANGYWSVALCNRSKRPYGLAWQIGARANPPTAVRIRPKRSALNIGISCDGLRAIDIDVDDATLAYRCEAMAAEEFGETIARWRANSSRRLLFYRAATGAPPKRSLVGTHGKVEILGRGQQFLAFGLHPTGVPLKWRPASPCEVDRSDLPPISEPALDGLLTRLAPVIGAAGQRQQPLTYGPPAPPQADLSRIVEALERIPNDGPADWDFWNHIGMAAFAASGGHPRGFRAWDQWSARHAAYDQAATAERWRHYHKSPPGRVGFGTLFKLAELAMFHD
jgi:hypothetical protein